MGNLADVFQRLIREHCQNAPDELGAMLVQELKKQRKPPAVDPLSVAVGLSKRDAAKFLRQVRVMEAREFLKDLETGAKTLYVLLKEGNNIATHNKELAGVYYRSGGFLLVEVTLID